jgi:hypothetical protein
MCLFGERLQYVGTPPPSPVARENTKKHQQPPPRPQTRCGHHEEKTPPESRSHKKKKQKAKKRDTDIEKAIRTQKPGGESSKEGGREQAYAKLTAAATEGDDLELARSNFLAQYRKS